MEEMEYADREATWKEKPKEASKQTKMATEGILEHQQNRTGKVKTQLHMVRASPQSFLCSFMMKAKTSTADVLLKYA